MAPWLQNSPPQRLCSWIHPSPLILCFAQKLSTTFEHPLVIDEATCVCVSVSDKENMPRASHQTTLVLEGGNMKRSALWPWLMEVSLFLGSVQLSNLLRFLKNLITIYLCYSTMANNQLVMVCDTHAEGLFQKCHILVQSLLLNAEPFLLPFYIWFSVLHLPCFFMTVNGTGSSLIALLLWLEQNGLRNGVEGLIYGHPDWIKIYLGMRATEVWEAKKRVQK